MLKLLVAVAALAMASAASASAPAGASADPGRISGIWLNADYKTSARFDIREGLIRTADGQLPPMQPWAAALVEKRIRDAEAGAPFATTKSVCLPGGVPQVMFGPRLPIEIMATPGKVTMLIEEFTNFRQVFMGEQHPASDEIDPSYMGHSVGRWEGDTLVVDTVGLTERTALDPVGTPHSDQLHIVERFRRIAEDKLELVVLVEDPKTFTRPWTARTTFQAVPQMRLRENICENNRNVADAEGVQTSGVAVKE